MLVPIFLNWYYIGRCPLNNDDVKLRVFIELCLEEVLQVTVSELAYYYGSTCKSKVQSFLSSFGGNKQGLVDILTIILNLAVVTAYQPGEFQTRVVPTAQIAAPKAYQSGRDRRILPDVPQHVRG